MKNRLWLLVTLVLTLMSSSSLQAQNTVGGRAAGMAGASLTLRDLWSVFHNQAGLAGVSRLSAGIFNETSFMMADISTRGVAVAAPVKNGTLAAQMQLFGFSLYNEKRIGVAYARQLSQAVSAGIQLDYFGVSIAEGYGSASAVTFEGGFQVQLLDGFLMAAHVYNPLRVKIADYNDERLPAILRFGMSYRPSDKVILAAEAEKDIDRPERIKAGVEYQIAKPLILRTGIASAPFNSSFGIGLIFDAFRFDFAATHHPQLGYTPNVSLLWSGRK